MKARPFVFLFLYVVICFVVFYLVLLRSSSRPQETPVPVQSDFNLTVVSVKAVKSVEVGGDDLYFSTCNQAQECNNTPSVIYPRPHPLAGNLPRQQVVNSSKADQFASLLLWKNGVLAKGATESYTIRLSDKDHFTPDDLIGTIDLKMSRDNSGQTSYVWSHQGEILADNMKAQSPVIFLNDSQGHHGEYSVQLMVTPSVDAGK